jgi:hypothetical protein
LQDLATCVWRSVWKRLCFVSKRSGSWTVSVFNRGKLTITVHYKNSKFALVHHRQKVMQEKLEFPSVFNLWLDILPCYWVAVSNFLVCLMIKSVCLIWVSQSQL